MLDYAISQNIRQGPTRRTLVCGAVSALVHLALALMLIEFPQLLEGGFYHQFRGIQRTADAESSKEWRTVAILESPRSMEMPSAETLKQILAKLDAKGKGAPPIRVRFGDLTAAISELPPMPKNAPKIKEPAATLPPNEVVSSGPEVKPKPEAGDAGGTQKNLFTEKGSAPIASSSKGETETASNAAPAKIPDSIQPPPAPSPAIAAGSKPADNAGKSTRSSGIDLLGTQGFPMGDYKDIIVERVRAKWFIPSNLKKSQGRTTVVFHIDKEGRCANLRVSAPSGSNSLDLAALSAVTESDPFPPLPKGFPGDHIGVKLVLIVEP